MKAEFLSFYRQIRECYGRLLLEMEQVRNSIDETADLNEQADRVYALRESEKVMADLAKEVRKLFDLQQKLACITQMTGTQDEAITEYCRGKADEKQILDVPYKRDKDPEAFDKIMEHIGVPSSVYMAELVRFHWPNMQDFLNAQLAEGRSIPVKMEDTFIYKFPVRKKKGLDVD
jgi:hypothetical protein